MIHGWKLVGLAGLLAALLTPGSALAAWSEARSRHFVVYSDGSTKQLQRFSDQLERFDHLLRLATGVQGGDSSPPVRVYLVRNAQRVQAIADRKYLSGFYSVGPRSGFAVVSRAEGNGPFAADGQDVLFHEYSHHFMLHYFPSAYPAWYVEGFAEFYSTAEFADDGQVSLGRIPMARVPTLVTLPLFPLKALFEKEPQGLGDMEMNRFYATAWLLTHFLRATPARGAEFTAYLKDLGAGKEDVSPDRYFNGGLDAVEKELRQYKEKRLTYMRFSFPTPPEISVTLSAMPADEAALMQWQIALMAGVEKADQAKFAADVRTATAAWPQSSYAAALLADAERLEGNEDAARGAADRAIAIDPRNARALGTRAAIALEDAHKSDKEQDWKAALSFIVRANRADTEDPVPLEEYYRYYRMRGGDVPKLAYDGLYRAYTLLPQSPSIRFQLAASFANRRDFDSAAIILTPLAFSPHASPMKDAAAHLRGQFLAVKEGKASPATAAAQAEGAGDEDE